MAKRFLARVLPIASDQFPNCNLAVEAIEKLYIDREPEEFESLSNNPLFGFLKIDHYRFRSGRLDLMTKITVCVFFSYRFDLISLFGSVFVCTLTFIAIRFYRIKYSRIHCS